MYYTDVFFQLILILVQRNSLELIFGGSYNFIIHIFILLSLISTYKYPLRDKVSSSNIVDLGYIPYPEVNFIPIRDM